MISEADYLSKIDARLNYYDVNEMIALFEEAKSISIESVYLFLEQLIGAPTWKNNSIQISKNIDLVLEYVDVNFNDRLKNIALEAIVAKINGKKLPMRRALLLMNQVKKATKSYALLNIIYWSTRRNRKINIIEDFQESIHKEWSKKVAE